MSDLQNTENKDNEQLSLNDDRRVRTLSPGALVAQRFFRNRLAVVGMVMLISMFIFSFIGGLISPYRQDEQFYKYTDLKKEYAAVTQNADFRYLSADGQNFESVAQAKFLLAQGKGETTFETKDATYELTEEGKDFYMISMNG
ncbi:MAG: ABC transporter permease, partial [Lachnospiraceae bacterium]|nr:ABC transporter permease [Lachnospiraceae bacterium]